MTIEEAIASARGDAEVMERCGGSYKPAVVLRMLDAIERAAVPFASWLSESDAMLRSGRGITYFRSRFIGWERSGLAEKRGRIRYYRAAVVPQREHCAVA